jgi:hypothetical protein
MRTFSLLAFVVSLVSLICGPAAVVHAKPAKEKKQPEAEAKAAGGPELNSCGCYPTSDGSCKCVKKSKCGCAGECEPAGCEEKRRKEQEREAQEEVKRQQETEKKRNAELAKKREEQDRTEDSHSTRLRGGKPEGHHADAKPAE